MSNYKAQSRQKKQAEERTNVLDQLAALSESSSTEEEVDEEPELMDDKRVFQSLRFSPEAYVNRLTSEFFRSEDDKYKVSFSKNPFHPLFEVDFNRLTTFKNETDKDIADLTRECQQAEAVHSTTVQELIASMTAVGAKLQNLDHRITKTSHTAVHIGHTLESFDADKRRYLAGSEMIAHYFDFAAGEVAGTSIFNSRKLSDIYRAAHLIQTLTTMVKQLQTDGKVNTEQASKLILAKSRQIEKLLLQHFEAARTSKNTNIMCECASRCLKFKGNRFIESYVLQSIDGLPSDVQTEAEMETGQGLSLTVVRRRLERFYDNVVQLCESQFPLIFKIFPGDVPVVKHMIETIFNTKISTFIASILAGSVMTSSQINGTQPLQPSSNSSAHLGPDAYLRLLEEAYVQSLGLCKDFHSILLLHSRSQLSAESTTVLQSEEQHGMVDERGNGGAKPQSDDPWFGVNLGELLQGVFRRYMRDYLEKEKSCLVANCKETIAAKKEAGVAEQTKENKTAPPVAGKGYLGSLFSSSSSNNSGSAGTGGPSSEEKQFQKFVSLLSSSIVDDCIEHSRNAMDRCIAVSEVFLPNGGTEAGGTGSCNTSNAARVGVPSATLASPTSSSSLIVLQRIIDIYFTLFTTVLEQWVNPLLAVLPGGGAAPSSPTERLLLALIYHLDLCFESLDVHYQDTVVACIRQLGTGTAFTVLPSLATTPEKEDSPDFEMFASASSVTNIMHMCDTRKAKLLRPVQSSIAVALSSCLHAVICQVQNILKEQTSHEYTPKDLNLLDLAGGDVAMKVVTFVHSHHMELVTSLNEFNLEHYLHLFGVRLYQVLSKHIRSFTVSTLGAGVLIRDIKSYSECVQPFRNESVNALFRMLKNLSGIFFVSVHKIGPLLGELAQEYNGTGDTKLLLSPKDLHDFLKMRDDYLANKDLLIAQLPNTA